MLPPMASPHTSLRAKIPTGSAFVGARTKRQRSMERPVDATCDYLIIDTAKTDSEASFIVASGSVCTAASDCAASPTPHEGTGYARIYAQQLQGVPIAQWAVDLSQGYLTGMVTPVTAKTIWIDEGFNAVRGMIYGKSAHLQPGVEHVNMTMYDNDNDCGSGGTCAKFTPGLNGGGQTTSLKHVQAANPNVETHIIQNLWYGESPMPGWAVEGGVAYPKVPIIPERYAILLADFLEKYQSLGIDVTELGLNTESDLVWGKEFCEVMGNLTQLKANRSLAIGNKIQMPSEYQAEYTWAKEVDDLGCLHYLSDNGFHYYGQQRQTGQYNKMLKASSEAKRNGLPFFHTELHRLGSEGDFLGLREPDLAEDLLAHFADCTAAGTSKFAWWHYNGENTLGCGGYSNCSKWNDMLSYMLTHMAPVGSQMLLTDRLGRP
eukprot:19846-Prymnesium_polylepis.1